jgi:toxin-antitoxin system PIN domain toxin
MISLLDVNVLLALAGTVHVHHDAAHRWFAATRREGWSSCVHTEMGFIRLSMQPAVVKTTIGFADALKALTNSISAPGHVFWPLDRTSAEIDGEIRERIAGHHQIADGLLLDLRSGLAVSLPSSIGGSSFCSPGTRRIGQQSNSFPHKRGFRLRFF